MSAKKEPPTLPAKRKTRKAARPAASATSPEADSAANATSQLLKSLLLPYQRRWVEDRSRFKIGVQSRQTGKSFQTACEAVADCMGNPGAKWVCLSAGERQALEWLEKCREWADACKVMLETSDQRDMGESLLRQAEIRFPKGGRIIAIPANPSTARGYSANIVLDEFAYHEDPDAIWAAMFPALTNPLAGMFKRRVEALATGQEVGGIRRDLKIRVVSTFNGRDNKFFDLWEKREANDYSGHLVTIHDAIADGLPIDAEALRTGLDDPDAWAQEYECQPTDTSAVLLPYDLIAQAESAEASEAADEAFWQTSGGHPVFCGIDFGRSNDPTVCWTLERKDGVLWTREVLVLRNTETPEQVDILRRRIRRATRVALDCTGPGVGLGDYLKREFGQWLPGQHSYGRVELCTFSVALKREMFPLLRRQFAAPAQLRVPVSRAVREDLHAMQQVVTNGEYNYWAPRTREGHSDRCTALALAVRAAGDAAGKSGPITEQTLPMIRFGGQGVGGGVRFQPRRLF